MTNNYSYPYTLRGCILPEKNVEVIYRYGYGINLLKNYEEMDIVVSLSLASGFTSDWKSGSVLLPTTFTPFHIDKMTVYPDEKYHVQNHLLQNLDEVLTRQSPELIDRINHHHLSENPKKLKQHAKPFQKVDFHEAHLLQADGLFNPKQLPDQFHFR